MNEQNLGFQKTLDPNKMFYYKNEDIASNVIETSLILATLIFLAWIVKLALEKDEA